MPRLRPRIPGAVAAAALLAAALAAPAASAQPAAPSPAPAAEAGQQQAQEGRRSSQIVGSAVYNDRDERIGAVDDLIVGQDGRISEAVLSVGGFLGLGAKLVAVPYDRLRFEPRSAERAADGPAPAAPAGAPAVPDPAAEERWRTDAGAAAPTGPAPEAGRSPAAAPLVARLVARPRLALLPGATQESLRALPEFNYRD
jgi:sporulation protein YlmC with PRC-barrel domain